MMPMDQKLFDEVIYLLDELAQDNTIPKNVRKNAVDSKGKLSNKNESLDLRCATIISTLDDLTNDPNVPPHARTFLYTLMSKLESLAKS